MSNFRIKKDKKKVEKPNKIKAFSTLDKKHREKIVEFHKNESTKDKLEQKLEQIKSEIKFIENQKKYDTKNINRKNKLLNELDKIELKLIEIKNNNEMDYYNKAGDLICDYYK